MSLADMVAQLESGGGKYNNLQPASMVNPTYGQYSGFVNQYGYGATGVDNFAQATLTANPNATVGDFYASYVLGTGKPGQYSWSDLQSTTVPGARGAANNFLNNSGVDPNTPLSSYINQGTMSSGVTDNAAGGTAAYDPSTVSGGWLSSIFGGPGSQRATGTGTSTVAGSGQNVQIGAQPGLLKAIDTFVGGIGSYFTNWVTRGFLIIIGLVVAAIAIVHLMAPGAIQRTAGRLAKLP